MAEKFNNYLVSIPFSSTNKTVVIVPQQGGSLPASGTVTSATGSRTSGATSQIHSIYLTKSDVSTIVSNPENNGSVVSISVYDTTNSKEYFIAKAVMVLPNSSFYVEKTITLRPQDCIRLTYHGNKAGQFNNSSIDAICSGVDLT